MTDDTIHTCSYSCERPGCIRAQRDELVSRLEALTAAQRPAAVDEAMVERACRHWCVQWDKADRATKMLWAEKMYDLLAAALATQHQEPKP